MNIALIGYGSMGRRVADVARARNHTISAIIDRNSSGTTAKFVTAKSLAEADIAIDFSGADAILDSTRTAVEARIPLLVGTTGWQKDFKKVQALVGKKIGFLWSSNFSTGVNIYFRIVAEAARLMDSFDEYDVWGHEIHHSGKADSPSGTAKTLEKILLDAIRRKKSVVEDRLDRKRADSEIHFSSVRGGPVNFGHTIGLDSAADRILLIHEARSRDGYALGAVKAAEWLVNKKGFFDMEDYMRAVLATR